MLKYSEEWLKKWKVFVIVKQLFLVSLEILHILFLNPQYVSIMKSYAAVHDVISIFTCLPCFNVAIYLSLSSFSSINDIRNLYYILLEYREKENTENVLVMLVLDGYLFCMLCSGPN